jgi:transcriptional regulator with XRE-family HTH domain
MDLAELGSVLSAGRSRLQPADVGLPAGNRRRVPGLRREEVAMLAGMSVDYLVRLEQGRGSRPSGQVLGALARTLRLTVDERDRLYRLAGSEPPARDRIDNLVRRSTMRLLQRLTDLPAMVIDAKGDLLAWNDLALALIGDVTALSHQERNFNRLAFSEHGDLTRRVVYDSPEQRERAVAKIVSDLRATAAKYPNDPDLSELIDDLRQQSRIFTRLWDEGRVEMRRASVKTFDHPDTGRLTLDCDVAILPDSDQRLIIYSAEPGTSDWSALELLRVIGVQRLAPSNEPARE